MKIFSLLLLSSILILAQPPQRIIYVNSAPSGSCGNAASMQRLISNGHLYSCNAGTWSDITGAGGGSIASTTNLLKGNGSGSAVDSNNQVTKPSFGDNSTLIPTTSFVQQAIAALNPLTSADAGTVAVLPFTPTYNNGTAGVGATLTAGSNGVLVIDGYTVLLNDRLLIKNQASTFQNGLYDVTTLGTASVPYVLTRSTDFNTSANMDNTQSIPVINGTVNAGTLWLQTATVVIVGTDPLTFVQIGSGAQGPQNVKSVNGVSYPASPSLNTVPVVTSTAKGGSITYEAVPVAALNSQTRKVSCQPGLGDGLNAIAAGTYLESTCYNDSGATITLSGFKCFTDNNGTSTMNVTNSSGTALLTGAVTCTNSFASGTQSATVTLANNDYMKFTFVADGTSKQTTWVATETK